MHRRRLVVRDRQARPLSELTVGDSGGRLCYVVAATRPVSVAVALEEDQVLELIAALSAWRDDQEDTRAVGHPFRSEQSTGV